MNLDSSVIYGLYAGEVKVERLGHLLPLGGLLLAHALYNQHLGLVVAGLGKILDHLDILVIGHSVAHDAGNIESFSVELFSDGLVGGGGSGRLLGPRLLVERPDAVGDLVRAGVGVVGLVDVDDLEPGLLRGTEAEGCPLRAAEVNLFR